MVLSNIEIEDKLVNGLVGQAKVFKDLIFPMVKLKLLKLYLMMLQLEKVFSIQMSLEGVIK